MASPNHPHQLSWIKNYPLLVATLLVGVVMVVMAIDANSEHTIYRVKKAQELIIKGEHKKAAQALNALLLTELPKGIKEKIFFQLVDLELLHLNNTKQALKILKNADRYELSGPETEVKINHYFAQIYDVQERQCDKAIPYYQLLIKYLPKLEKYDEYVFLLAKCYKNLGKLKDSINYLNVLVRDPNPGPYFLKAELQLVICYYLSRQLPKALNQIKSYQEQETDNELLVYSSFLKANILEDQEQLEEAYKVYSSLLYQYPNQELIRKRLSSIYERRASRKR